LGSSALNLPTSLLLHQDSYEDIRILARYETKPFYEAPYYAVLIGTSKWEIQLIHHKIYLKNPTPEIQHFAVSHGYNILSLNKLYRGENFEKRIGGGVILSHPETEIRNKKFPEKGGLGKFFKPLDGFFLSGPSLSVGIGKRFYPVRFLVFDIQGIFNISLAWIPISDGKAFVPNIALHFIIGTGFIYP